MTNTFYSTNDEWLGCDSVEEAYQEFVDAEYVDSTFEQFSLDNPKIRIYTADFEKNSASLYFPLGRELTEIAIGRAYDVCVETSEWLENISDDQVNELSEAVDKVINAWASKNNLHPEFYQCIGGIGETFVRPLTETTCEEINNDKS